MSSNRYTFTDAEGFPVLFASRDRSPIELITPEATSGPAEWGRYHDAVREAARSYDNPDEGDIHHFLKARAKHPEKVDVPSFHEAVKRQRMADLVDITDHHLRRDGSLPRGSRHIRVQAPKGYLKRALRNSSTQDIAHLHHRLISIGHSNEHVSNFLSSRVQPDMWDQASSIEVRMSEKEFTGLNFDSGSYEAEWDDPLTDFIEAVRQIEIKPIVNVFVDSKSPKE